MRQQLRSNGSDQNTVVLAPEEGDIQAARKYFAKAKSESTQRAYARHWAEFEEYCQWRKRQALPADARAVVGYLTYAADAGASPSTLRQKLAAISWVHTVKKHPSPSQFPEVITLMEGIVRSKQHKTRKLKPLLIRELRNVVTAIESPYPANIRDRAMVLVAYFGLLRRSELAALSISNVKIAGNQLSMVITIQFSKTDQAGQGNELIYPALPRDNADICPVLALTEWMSLLRDEFGVVDGPLFRKIDRWGHLGAEALTPQVLNSIIKKLAQAIGIDPSQISAHSALRAGMATQLDANGQPFSVIKRRGRWKSDTVASSYIRPGDREMMDALRDVAIKS